MVLPDKFGARFVRVYSQARFGEHFGFGKWPVLQTNQRLAIRSDKECGRVRAKRS
jgi:hypothetical protein